MSKTYKFLNYVANGNGIKFASATDVSNVTRFDHQIAQAPGSTKSDPLSVLRNSISLNRRISVPSTCAGCDRVVPIGVTISWSAPASNPAAAEAALDDALAFLQAKRALLNSGFLPDTSDITIDTVEAG